MSDPAARLGRAFLALRPPEEVLEAVAVATGAAREVEPGWGWAKREQWHLTLAFLGPVEDPVGLTEALESLRVHPAVGLRLAGAGAFPSVRRATVAWLGSDEGTAAVTALAGAVERAVTPLGFDVGARRFHPHLTVARARQPRNAVSLLAALGEGPFGPPFLAGEVVLYESRLGAGGARYRPVVGIPLEGAAPPPADGDA